MSTVRLARDEDVDRLVELGAHMHAESPRFSRLAFDAVKFEGFLRHLVDDRNGCAFVAEQGGEIVGGFIGLCFPHWCSHDWMATDLALFIEPKCRGGMAAARLIRAFVDWARGRNAVIVQAGVSTGIHDDEAGRLYEVVGFRPCGRIYEV